ncbi:MAG TPA: GGDEF domain-containing phosphodiesterase, partial [Micromonosporaceae bacterium]
LITAADRIRTSIRDVDLGARLGGDEFAALLPEVNTEQAYATAERIAEVLALPAMVSGLPVSCPASIGVATATTADEYAQVMRRADAALYAAKADGKGRWRAYRPLMRSPLHRGSDLRAELQNVLHGAGVDAPDMGGLTMHYQPIVQLADGSVYGYEALIRWRHPARGSIPVAELIQVAEQTGLIVPLGNWALSQTVSDAVKLARVSDDAARYVSANVSPTQLRQPDFADRLRDAISAAGADPSQIIIEMTESQPLTGDDEIWQVLGDLRSDGIRIAIDDYGTGHASLGYLRQPIIDILKLDRMFLTGVADPRGRLLVDAVIKLTRELHIDLVAEGVEDDATREMLVELGCTLGQGHLFARAMPLADAAQWSFAVPAGSTRHE